MNIILVADEHFDVVAMEKSCRSCNNKEKKMARLDIEQEWLARKKDLDIIVKSMREAITAPTCMLVDAMEDSKKTD